MTLLSRVCHCRVNSQIYLQITWLSEKVLVQQKNLIYSFGKCYFANNKADFYRAFNNIFGKIGWTASDEVLFALIKSKCLPILFYVIEACPLNYLLSITGVHRE